MALGFGCIHSCDLSSIPIFAILYLTFWLSSSWKFVALCDYKNQHNRAQLPGGFTSVLHNVRHVPELSRSLISVGQLDEDGIHANFSSGGWTLHKGNLLLARGPKIHLLYLLYVTLREGEILLLGSSVLRAFPVWQTYSRDTPRICPKRIESTRFRLLGRLWPYATSVSRRCVVLCQL